MITSMTCFKCIGKIIEVVIPDEVPIDIRVKMMVCLIHQNVIQPLDVSTFTRIHRFLSNIVDF